MAKKNILAAHNFLFIISRQRSIETAIGALSRLSRKPSELCLDSPDIPSGYAGDGGDGDEAADPIEPAPNGSSALRD